MKIKNVTETQYLTFHRCDYTTSAAIREEKEKALCWVFSLQSVFVTPFSCARLFSAPAVNIIFGEETNQY